MSTTRTESTKQPLKSGMKAAPAKTTGNKGKEATSKIEKKLGKPGKHH
ncbi:MAG: hypothetical protein WBW92_04160 [Rhodanobacteraceae bacterium]